MLLYLYQLNQEMEELRAYKTEFTEQSKKFGYLEHKLVLNINAMLCLLNFVKHWHIFVSVESVLYFFW